MISGKTTSGFEFAIDDSVYDNMELVDALAEADEGNQLAVSRVCTLILGKDQKKRLYDHVRRDNGTVPIEAVTREILDIMNARAQGKN